MRGMIAGGLGGAGALGLLGVGICSPVLLVFILLHRLGGCCPAQRVDLLFVCCGLMRTESNRDACSPNRLLLLGEVVCSLLTLLQLAFWFPRMSVSLLSSLGGLL